ncbi:MAG: hypothetical protein WD988_05120 [Candidatus Curtissbacteria bacterium]
MKLKKYLIAGGNPTLLVWNCPEKKKVDVCNRYLGKVEQVGFISKSQDNKPVLEMMGNELCINATIALASLLGKSDALRTSSLDKPIGFLNKNGITSLELPLIYRVTGDIVLFPGIGFKYSKKTSVPTKSYLRKLCGRYNRPAFGVATYKKSVLTPYVYVKNTRSLFKETACGSGSIAAAIFTGDRNIVQPSGEKISVGLTKSTVLISANVKELPL